MWLAAVRESTCNSEECPTCGGGVQRRVYGEMHAGSFVLDGQRVAIRKVPNEGFIGPVVLDPLTQYFDGGLYRLWPSERYFSRGGKKLHRDVWASAFGDIPKGCHIHHKDSNPANNKLENLECVPAFDHLSETWTRTRANRKPGEHFSEVARKRAAEWHASEEGRLWHKRHAARSKGWLKWRREDRTCSACGKQFNAIVRKSGHSQIYCTDVCKAAAYRKRERDKRAG